MSARTLPLHLAAARLRRPAAPADDDEDWDAVIARAKLRAASPRAPSPLPPPPLRNEWAEMPATPPPEPKAPRARAPGATQATLDAIARRCLTKTTAPPGARPSFGPARRP